MRCRHIVGCLRFWAEAHQQSDVKCRGRASCWGGAVTSRFPWVAGCCMILRACLAGLPEQLPG
jgi:hypothetical protein